MDEQAGAVVFGYVVTVILHFQQPPLTDKRSAGAVVFLPGGAQGDDGYAIYPSPK